jgi:REP element-mobilizing transposase RayT
MNFLLTWPTYGTWLPGPSHGRVEHFCGGEFILPEPDPAISLRRRRSLKWAAVMLHERHRAALQSDLPRIESIRGFRTRRFIVVEDHTHLLFEAPEECDLMRLVQLIKGTLARALSVAGGDPAPIGTRGERLPHQKWWARQHVLQILTDDESLAAALRALKRAHPDGS